MLSKVVFYRLEVVLNDSREVSEMMIRAKERVVLRVFASTRESEHYFASGHAARPSGTAAPRARCVALRRSGPFASTKGDDHDVA